MKKILKATIKLFRNKLFLYSLITVSMIAITVVHIIMYNKYSGTPEEPSWQLTLIIHIGILIALIVGVVVYKKYVKPIIDEYDKE